MKLTSSCNAAKTLNANNMETLIECQSEGDIKEHPLLASCESEDSVCQLIEIKKRKKVLSWPFLLKRLSPASDFSGTSDPELKASLFDQPLSIICGDDDTLPRPIQDILTILCLKGPSTEGIFRKAANEKARKELKEELNSGGAVDLTGLPVHLLAAVFKDFLRSIPLKLLSCDLFEEWMGALEKQSEEQRIEALKRVAEKLPRPNLLLLKHLVPVLYLISRNCEVSKMDASNLAICVGPNMLAWGDDQDLSLEAQRGLSNKVKTLVEFLIDNCLEIFGENIPARPSTASDDSLEHADGSDSSTLQSDSAYDSNDPDVDSGGAVGSPTRPPQVPAETTAGLAPRGPHAGRVGREPIVSTVARLKSSLTEPDRRHSEPNMSSLPGYLESGKTSHKLTRSEDDFTQARPASRFESEEAEDPFPEEVFPTAGGNNQRPWDLPVKNSPQGSAPPCGQALKASSGSLDTSSDGSPAASPSSPKRNFFTRHQSFTKADRSKPSREIKKHSMSFSFASQKRGLTKNPSSGPVKSKGFARDQVRKELRKESQLAGRIIRGSASEIHGHTAPAPGPTACALSAEDVFRAVDRRSPGSPPSYEEAVRGPAPEPAACGGQTVGSMRARMLSLDAALARRLPSRHGAASGSARPQELPHGHGLLPRTEGWAGHASVGTAGPGAVIGRPERPWRRTASESRHKSKWDCPGRRRSQPLFDADQLQFARESYV